MTWRAEDQRLLERLEDEALFEQVWRALAGTDDGAPHPRAAGVLVALREDAETRGLVEAARRGDMAGLLKALHRPDPARLAPRHAHHLALLWDRVADVLEPTHETGSVLARKHSLAMWAWLAAEPAYLEALAERVIDGALPPPEVGRAVQEAPLASLDRLGARALADANERGDRGRLALAALRLVPEACDDAGCGDELRRRLEARSRRHREAAVDAAIRRVDDRIEQSLIDHAPVAELVEHASEAAAIWQWAGRDEQVERFLVQRLTPALWDRYRERAWSDVAALLRPLQAPVESLAIRIESDPSKLAYAAPCAQIFVFMAEVASQFERQLALAERALLLCETHRNGRLVLADLLVERGLRRLDRAGVFGAGDALNDAAADIRRAESLFPQLKRLPAAKQRLKAKGVDLDA